MKRAVNWQVCMSNDPLNSFGIKCGNLHQTERESCLISGFQLLALYSHQADILSSLSRFEGKYSWILHIYARLVNNTTIFHANTWSAFSWGVCCWICPSNKLFQIQLPHALDMTASQWGICMNNNLFCIFGLHSWRYKIYHEIWQLCDIQPNESLS